MMLAWEMKIVVRLLCPNHLPVELEADQEHEEDDAGLRVHAQQRHDGRRQQRRGEAGRRPAEQRRAEQDSANQLANHRRLVDPLKDVSHQPRRRDDRQRAPRGTEGRSRVRDHKAVDYRPKLSAVHEAR